MQKQGFIAAPLLGTMIFLICVLAIINITRIERQSVADIIGDAYHNRLVSIVEIYRNDLGSVFNIGLQRNIEYGLTSQCWDNFIPLSGKEKVDSFTKQSTLYLDNIVYDDADADNVVTEQEQRFFICARSNELIKAVVCSKNATYLFGLSSWAKILASETSFEGITLNASNTESFLKLISPYYYSANGTDLCRNLLSRVEFDCKNFAEHPDSQTFRCCSEFNPDFSCKTVAPGCESGDQFFIRVGVQNNQVYRYFPRVYAEDSAGNKIRTGVITDADYDAPVTYPFFKYLDAAFKFNKYLAFGNNTKEDAAANPDQDIGGKRGIVEGSCEGASCSQAGVIPSFYNIPGAYGAATYAGGDSAKDEYFKSFFNGVAKPACSVVKTSYNLDTYFNYFSTIPATKIYCSNTSASDQQLRDYFNLNSIQCAAGYCAYINSLSSVVTFADNDPTTQVRSDQKNEFCWKAKPTFIG